MCVKDYIHKDNDSDNFKIKIMNFLVCEPGLLHHLRGDLFENKLMYLVSSIPYEEGMFEEFLPGSLEVAFLFI